MPQPVFEKVPTNVSFPAIEERILELWDRLDAFAESNRRRPAGEAGGKEFVFYDGPPPRPHDRTFSLRSPTRMPRDGR